MSTLFGIYNRNGDLIDPKIVNDMHVALSSWGSDESGSCHEDAVVLGHEMLWNTPESKQEHLPLEQEQFVITMDARLDNRQDLAELLEMGDRPLQQVTDSEFILAAYCRWEEECPKYLVGDFAFVIWDKAKKQLFCARDHLGVKPFYFHLTERLFVFSNDLKGIVAHPDISRTLNDKAVANYLVNGLLINSSLTFFKDIEKLPAAHTVTITASSVCKHCYWRAEDAPAVVLPNAEAYAERLRELLEQAVHDRIRSAYPISSHLSGGLDSSTIATIAARKLRKKGDKLLAFNWLHEPAEDDDPANHEWANSRETAELEGIDHSYISITADDIYHHMSRHSIAYGDSAGFWYEYIVQKNVQQKDSRTILSGWGGDELSTYHGHSYLSNMLKEGQFAILMRELKARVRKKKQRLKLSLRIVYDYVLLPFVPRCLYRKMPRSMNPERSSFQFVQHDFLQAVQQEKKKIPTVTMQPQITIRGHMLALLRHGHLQARMESWATSGRANRVEYNYPLLDKRIVEFILGVPAQYFVHNSIGRYLFRSAANGLLPDQRLWRNDKIETHRVDRLLSASCLAYKLLLNDLLKQNVHSKYTDIDNLIKILTLSKKDPNLLKILPEAGYSISVIQCDKTK